MALAQHITRNYAYPILAYCLSGCRALLRSHYFACHMRCHLLPFPFNTRDSEEDTDSYRDIHLLYTSNRPRIVFANSHHRLPSWICACAPLAAHAGYCFVVAATRECILCY